jgi:tripartite-type tricarboxylate transporter receptor subunit TctC
MEETMRILTKSACAPLRLTNVLLGVLLLFSALPAGAQALSTRPVRIVMPYAPSGPTDLGFRALGDAISPILGVPVVMENRPGASGKIAAEAVARAEPDGHTLLVAAATQIVTLPLLDKTVSYKALEDFRMISQFVEFDIIFFASAASGIKTMKELAARMQKKDEVVFASIGQPQLTSTGLAFLAFAKMTNGSALEIAYSGQAPAVLEMLAGRVTVGTYTVSGMLPHVQSGKLVALAVASPTRMPELPDTPTMTEAGFPEYMAAANWKPWIGIVAPGKTPEAIVNVLNRAIVQAAQTEVLRTRIGQAGLVLRAKGTAAQDDAAWRSEFERLAALLKRFDIRLPEEKK